MNRKKRSAGGAILLHTLVTVVLLAILAVITLNLTMGRSLTVSKVMETDSAILLAEDAASRLNECMKDVDSTTCTATRIQSCGFPFTQNSRTYSASASWNNGACRIVVTIN